MNNENYDLEWNRICRIYNAIIVIHDDTNFLHHIINHLVISLLHYSLQTLSM